MAFRFRKGVLESLRVDEVNFLMECGGFTRDNLRHMRPEGRGVSIESFIACAVYLVTAVGEFADDTYASLCEGTDSGPMNKLPRGKPALDHLLNINESLKERLGAIVREAGDARDESAMAISAVAGSALTAEFIAGREREFSTSAAFIGRDDGASHLPSQQNLNDRNLAPALDLSAGGLSPTEAATPDSTGVPATRLPKSDSNGRLRRSANAWTLGAAAIAGVLMATTTALYRSENQRLRQEVDHPTEEKAAVTQRAQELQDEVGRLQRQLKDHSPIDALPTEPAALSTYMQRVDAEVFYGASDNRYEVARVIPDRPLLRATTSFVEEVAGAVHTFDMLANTAGVVREEWMPVIVDGLKRGVDYRVILSDYRDSNPHYEAFSHSVGEDGMMAARGASLEHHRQLESLFAQIKADAARGAEREYRGSLQVRWNPNLLLYTMWLRDAAAPEGMGHLGVHFYRGKNYWPCFRVSRRTADGLLANMATEFETAWQTSHPYETIPYAPADTAGAGGH